MSLKIAAEHLKSKGRGPDTELVHMTKGEIKGLRQLAMSQGGDLTINPETGLYEAGFLSKILPIVAAGAATYFTAGAAAPALTAALSGTALAGAGGILAGAGAGALIGGASSALQGGDVGKGALFGGLGGAISGGLGAYDASPALDPSIINPETGLQQLAGPGMPTPQAPPSVPVDGPLQQLSGPGMPTNPIPNVPTPNVPELQKGFALNEYGDVYKIPTAPAPEPSYYSGLGSGMGDMAKKAAILAAPGIGAQMGAETYDENGVPTGESGSMLNRISPDFRAQEPIQPNPYYAAGYSDYKKKPYTGMADGGAVAFANRGIVQDLPRSSGADVGTYSDTDPNTAKLDAYNAALYRFSKANKKAGIKAPVQFKQAQALGDVEEAAAGGIMQSYQSGGPVERMSQMNTAINPQGGLYPQGMIDKTQYATPTQRPTSMEVLDAGAQRTFAAGGIMQGIGGYSDGGRMLKGPGDGMSDSIPAVIGRKQPARLADGEFVVPADVVSHLGNGSTDAGAKRLYGMMDKIRKARTGKKKQAPQVKAHKFLPA
jgi:hypothetical protein